MQLYEHFPGTISRSGFFCARCVGCDQGEAGHFAHRADQYGAPVRLATPRPDKDLVGSSC
jgi:hypothetical protein